MAVVGSDSGGGSGRSSGVAQHGAYMAVQATCM